MNAYQHIFFDLDHTLWDFDKNCAETLQEMYERHNLSRFDFTAEAFHTEYRKINDQMWHDYHRKLITKDDIRAHRFNRTFENLGLNPSIAPKGLDEEFLSVCPTKSHLHPHALEVLEYLSPRYPMHIITNGFKETQDIKMKSSGIAHYFIEVVNSETIGYLKPDKRIFDHAITLAGGSHATSIMIGDDLFADVLGARDAGMSEVFYNPHKKPHNETILHEIHTLAELKAIL
jgi:putative hydrolase of the HAD superfamily